MSPSIVDIVETPVVEAPIEAPIETPIQAAPVVEEPVVEEPVIESKGTSVEYLPLNSVDAVEFPAIGATKLRQMIFESKELIVCPGVYDGLSARTAIETGFDALYMVRLLHSVHALSWQANTNIDWCRHHCFPSWPA